MPYSDDPWGNAGFPFGEPPPEEDDFSYWGDDSGDTIWYPNDPIPWFSPTKPERRAYRDEMARMATVLSKENLSSVVRDRNGNVIERTPFAEAFGTSGEGGGAQWGSYRPAALGWTPWGEYQPRSQVSLSSWGWSYGLKDPFPILSGAIISPTINIFNQPREQEYDISGRPLHDPLRRVSSQLISGRATTGSIMQKAAERGRAELDRLVASGMPVHEAGPLAERLARQSVRAQVQPFGRADFGERWNTPYGLRQAIAGSAQIVFHGDYSLFPKALFKELGSLGSGYFTRATSASVDPEHPDRGAWPAYGLDSLYALGWLPTAGGGFITGSSKPAKRRQLGVQKLAAPIGADALLRTGRLTGDRMLNTTAVFLDNYPYSEGSGVADPTLLQGFRDYRPLTIEKPMRAGDDWQVRFTPQFASSDVSQMFGRRWKTVGQDHMHAPGESVFLGEQYVDGKWQPLEQLKGIEGVSQGVFGYRKTKSGYQALIEREFPWESGTAKLMHHGMKALLFQSSAIIEQMQGQVRAAMGAGRLPGNVADPRMVLPMPKDWLQTYHGMFDLLPEETLRSMGVADDVIKSKNWQRVGPGVVDKLHQYAEQHRFTFDERHEVPVSRLGAWTRVGNARDIAYFEKGGEQYARFTATHTGYALPIAAGIRMEYPGKKPMYSPEELMQLGQVFPGVAKGLLERGNAASRVWGVAAAATAGVTPQGAISHEMLPWASARLDLEGNLEDEGTSRKLIVNLARELTSQGQGRSAIVGPGGVLLPAPADVLGKSVMSLNGQEQSQFVSSYIQAMKLLGTGQDATKALAGFAQNLQTFAAGHNVRREALGARLERAAEGTFTSHMAIPDDVVVAGELTLRRLAGINRKDPQAGSRLDAFVQALEGGNDPFYVLGTRRPVSDMFNQLGVPMRVITERMAQERYGVPIENLGRSYAVSPTVAAIWRGDVDADRALLHAVTRAKWDREGTFIDEIGNSGEVSRMWQPGAVSFHTPKEVRQTAGQSLMVRQLAALRTHAPDAYQSYLGKLGGEGQLNLMTGLAGDRSTKSLLALSEALHGIDVDWTESKKWSDELRTGITKNNPHPYAWYADPANKTIFTREQMLADFERAAKSKMLMGRSYNRYLRGLTSLAGSPEELQAAVTLASNVYQKALDNQTMTEGELMFFNLMESLGPSGAMYDKFIKEEGYVGGGSAWTGGPAGMMAVLASSINDVDLPTDVRALLFSRDPAIQEAVRTGNTRAILTAVAGRQGEVAGSRAFLDDPNRVGILPQLVQAMHFSKGSIQGLNLSEAERAYGAQGQRIRSMIRVLGRGEKEGLPLSGYTKKETSGKEIAMLGAIGDIRAMGGLSTLSGWQRAMAGRMGLGEAFFAGPEAMAEILGIPARKAGGPVDDNEPYLVGEEGPEIFVPKTAGDIVKLPQDLQARIRNASDPRGEFQRVAAELEARVARSRAPEPGSEAVPPAADASIPVMVTRDMRQQLYDLGLSRADVDAMTPQEAHARLSQSGTVSPAGKPIPEWVQSEINSNFATAERMGLTGRIENMAAQRMTARQIASSLEQDMPDRDLIEREQLVRSVRSKMGIPSMEDQVEFDSWLSRHAEGTIPPAAGGNASIAHQVYEQYGGHSVFNAAIESIRTYKANRQQGEPLIPGDRLTRRAVNDIIARGGGEDAMREWAKIMGQHNVGFRYQMEDSPAGPRPVWSHSYGGLRSGRRSKAFAMPELSPEQYAQFEGMVGGALRGVIPDANTFLGNLTEQFMTTVREKSEFDVQSLPSLMPIFQQLMGYGDEMEVWQTMRGTSNMQTRLKLKPQGLKGHAKELLVDLVQGGLTEGYTPQVMDMMAQGYRHAGIGQGMIRSVRNLIDADFGRMDMKGAWRTWEDAQRVGGALGGDVPEAMLDRIDRLNETMTRLTDITEERVEQGKQEIGWREQFLRSPEGRRQMEGVAAYMTDVQGRTTAGQMLEQQDVRRLKNISEMYRRIGTPGASAMADNIDEMMGQQEFRVLAQMAGQGGGGGNLRGVWARLFSRGGQGGADGAPAIENMFTELTLGWTAFRARMAWNLATGAQRGFKFTRHSWRALAA